MNRSKATLMAILVIMLYAVAGAVYASDDPVYVLTPLSYEVGAFDSVLQTGRLTAGNTADSEYRIASVPLSNELEPMMDLPESEALSALLEIISRGERTDGQAFETGDVSVEFAISEDKYAVAARFNVEVQIDDLVFYPGSLITSDGENFHWLLPIVRDLPVTILMVNDKLLEKLERDIPAEDLPEAREFVMAHVTFSNENYRIISLAMENTAMIWLDTISERDADDLYGSLEDYNGTEGRPVSTPIPPSYTVRPLALMSIEERTQMWLDGDIVWDESNCFTLAGECYRQGYNGTVLSTGQFHGLVGTFLGVTVVDNHYVMYLGLTAQGGERYFIAIDTGTYETPNGLGVVVQATATIEGTSDMTAFVPWREDMGIDVAINSYIGSPVNLGLLAGNISGTAPEFDEYVRLLGSKYEEANIVAEYVYSATMGNTTPSEGDLGYVNLIVDSSNLENLAMVASMTFGRYV